MSEKLSLTSIRTDAGCQPRSGIIQEVVDDYATHLRSGGQLPPVVVFYDGEQNYLADGYHRYAAHVQRSLSQIRADVRQGTLRDAILYSLSANQSHGLRRTNEDKRRAVARLLTDDEWSDWSDGKIAEHVGVSHQFVRTLREELGPSTINESKLDGPKKRLGRDGKMRRVGRAKPSGPSRTSEYSQESDYEEPSRQVDEESPPGDAVSATDGGASVPSDAAAASGMPLDDREGGDSVVTEQDAERAAVVDPERKPPEAHMEANDGAGGSSEANARLAVGAHSRSGARGGEDEQTRASAVGAGGSPALRSETTVTLRVDADAISRFSTGLALVMAATRELDPDDAAVRYPEDMPLLSDEITLFVEWLYQFEETFRNQYGTGNDIALANQHEAAQ